MLPSGLIRLAKAKPDARVLARVVCGRATRGGSLPLKCFPGYHPSDGRARQIPVPQEPNDEPQSCQAAARRAVLVRAEIVRRRSRY